MLRDFRASLAQNGEQLRLQSTFYQAALNALVSADRYGGAAASRAAAEVQARAGELREVAEWLRGLDMGTEATEFEARFSRALAE